MNLLDRLARWLRSLLWWILGRCEKCGAPLESWDAYALFPQTYCRSCGWIAQEDGPRDL